ncbi:MAG: translation initiation factor IF-3 [Oligoflexia bacterium]|nr:translation initiation factor IF-3 [Oligoflexia bacterium]MBF0365937.1 translation initiation factor IF-3 [Oligoflexia bacterium]
MNEKKRSGGGPRINGEINVPEIRLIGEDGTQFGVVKINEARRIAHEKVLDLVEVSPGAVPPVVKLIDYGKFKYELQKKASEAKKKQIVVQVKEVQFRPNIEKHDLEVKTKRIEGFLGDGDKVRLVMQFRGREIAYKEAGLEKFNKIIEEIVSFGAQVESPPTFMGSKIFAIVMPVKKSK